MQNPNESRKANSAEAQVSKAPSEEDFVGQIKYLEEREKNLSKYSDKLRENVEKVWTKLDGTLPADFLMRGKDFFSEEEEYFGEISWHLATLAETEKWYAGIYVVKNYGTGEVQISIKDVSRKVLKALVSSGALIEFAKIAEETLAAAEQEYKQVADVAEKMAKAIE
jgi:hypothetical protein